MPTLDQINPYAGPKLAAVELTAVVVPESLDGEVIHAIGPVTFEAYRRSTRLSFRHKLMHSCSFSFLCTSVLLSNYSWQEAFLLGFGIIAIVFAVLLGAFYLLARTYFRLQALSLIHI